MCRSAGAAAATRASARTAHFVLATSASVPQHGLTSTSEGTNPARGEGPFTCVRAFVRHAATL